MEVEISQRQNQVANCVHMLSLPPSLEVQTRARASPQQFQVPMQFRQNSKHHEWHLHLPHIAAVPAERGSS